MENKNLIAEVEAVEKTEDLATIEKPELSPVKEPAKEEEKISKDIFKYKLSTPIEYQGKMVEDLTLDFGSLTGADAIRIEEEMEALNQYIMAPETSKAYQAKMAARAGGIPDDLVNMLSFRDFNRITNAARNFLVGQDL